MSTRNYRCDLCGAKCREAMAPVGTNMIVCDVCSIVLRRRAQWVNGIYADALLPTMRIRFPEPPPEPKRSWVMRAIWRWLHD